MTPQSKVVSMPKPGGMKAFMFYIDDWRSSWTVEAMDDHEKVAYLNLLMKAASEPDCGLPDNDFELAVISGLGTRWWKPTRTKSKRLGVTNSDGSVTFTTSGQKLKQCFGFRPETGQLPFGRLFNERMYEEHLRRQELTDRAKNERARRWEERKGKSEPAFSEHAHPHAEVHKDHQLPTTTLPTIEVGGETTTTSTPPSPQVAEEAPPPQRQIPHEPITDLEYEQFTKHCAEVTGPDGTRGVTIPSRELCRRLKAKFFGMTIEQLLEHLPKLPNQKSPGLWATVSRETLTLEAERQRQLLIDPPKKPSELEASYKRLMAYASSSRITP